MGLFPRSSQQGVRLSATRPESQD